ncbi:substrate-binding domain-containing protein [Dyadobacter chenwenxiniae]|uniref:Substrate-binding domain-containing protein n=2 Tax=Dyadobacter chenwenxiniae TaxID=2906456 RepID=A0A9X1PLY7_9BACT|nr:substrate-binding domain-containing protein [Dyadobacter chenwenxiniae]MCF0063555.1 substrate-binding domain-containing protein [Dyadobacter chenwenxiniae]UON83233.1 substrate-binding domain-containing protein [Dyadobacter chenwenxiniae]
MIKCVKCEQVDHIMKAGYVRGKQRYLCKTCNYYFTHSEKDPFAISAKRKRHQTTIIDIAKSLGVSNSTVSRALHGHADISPETRQAVLDKALQLDYQPNQLAYSLVKSKTNTIGMIVPEFHNPFFPNVIIGAHEVLTKAGYNLTIMQSNESYQVEISNTRAMLANRIDGLLISLTQETNNFDHLGVFEKRGIPLVLFNRVCEQIDVPKVVVNDFEASFLAVEHLIMNGYERIAHLGGPLTLSVSRERLRGYKAALEKHGKTIDDHMVIQGMLTQQKARIYGQYLLDLADRPDAIFAVNDSAAIEIILMAKEKGISIPDELGVVGFSDNPESAYIGPGLTTVRQPTLEMGRTTAEWVLQLVDLDDVHLPEKKILQTELIVRGSSRRCGD